ncbi:hypothetical protein M0R45_012947 [Rubus argutus]|uniref:Uncharacterized protein n=1 Tax=Rubus argutus TaxID=59490 RepID=A0AAW1XI65_RUBAR
MSTPESGQNPEKPPAKRPESDQIPNTEQPEAERPKLGDPQPKELGDPQPKVVGDDTGLGSQSSSEQGESEVDWDLSYCLICSKMVDHSTPECPDKSKGYGILCFVCKGPCKSSNDEHKGRQMECIKFCGICGSQAKHWSDDCPYEDSKYFYGVKPNTSDDDYGF